MSWPHDADGDVLRRLKSRGFDFDKKYLIDFNVDFEHWPPSPKAVALLAERYPSTNTYAPDTESKGYVQFQIYDRLSYELVTRIQAEISELMSQFEGVCNSWGVLN